MLKALLHNSWQFVGQHLSQLYLLFGPFAVLRDSLPDAWCNYTETPNDGFVLHTLQALFRLSWVLLDLWKCILSGAKKIGFARSSQRNSSSETQGQSAGSGEKARRKAVSSTKLSPDHFQTAKRMLALDWAQKMLCNIVPNRRTASPDFFLVISYTTAIGSIKVCLAPHQRNARSHETFSLI